MLTLSYSVTTQAKIYKWTDQQGVIHYSATPPVVNSAKTKVEDIESKIRSHAGKASTQSTRTYNTYDTQQKLAKKKNKGQSIEEKLKGPNKRLVAYCMGQRRNLEQIKNNYRTTWVEKGKKVKLDQAQRKEKAKYLADQISKNCEGV